MTRTVAEVLHRLRYVADVRNGAVDVGGVKEEDVSAGHALDLDQGADAVEAALLRIRLASTPGNEFTEPSEDQEQAAAEGATAVMEGV